MPKPHSHFPRISHEPVVTAAGTFFPDDMVDGFVAAVIIGRARRTLQDWRTDKKGPAYETINGCVRYRVSTLVAFKAASTVKHAA